MTIEQIISNVIMKQGIMAALLLILILMFKRFIVELFKVVGNNTEAMTKNASALYEMRDVIKDCKRK